MSKALREIQAFPKAARVIADEALAEVKKLRELNAELVEVLKYARRQVHASECDIAYIDRALAKAKEKA